MDQFYKACKLNGLLLPVLFVSLFVLTPFNKLFAEGSKEMNANGGSRAYMYSTSTANTVNIFPTLGTVKVFVRPGETIYVGSSAQNVGNGYIALRAPNGTNYSTQGLGNTGRIQTRAQEVAGPFMLITNLGGYVPATYTVGANQGGIWEIDFISPNQSNTATPTAISASGNWTQPSSAYIAAWDVSVRNTANTAFITGRAYMDIFTANLGAYNAAFNTIFNVLTKDGYKYVVNNNGQTGFGFSFFVNNKGVQTSTGAPSYKSVNGLSNLNLQDPREEDNDTAVTHKIFYNDPASDLPTSATIRGGGSTWLLNTPGTLTASNFTFTGAEGTANVSGTNPTGGNIGFTANVNANYAVDIDVNRNGSYADAVDRRLTGAAKAGSNTVFWDGLDGTGAKVAATTASFAVNMRVILFGGEVHFPFIDVENNVNGIIITRTNGSNPNVNTVNWDDTDITSSGTPSNPRKTGIDGVSSSTNGHKWGSAAYGSNDFGNEVLLDTWAYVLSSPLTSTVAITLQEADLETVSINANQTALCVGQSITYTVVMRNNGPTSVTGAKSRITVPANLTGVSFGTPVYAGGATATASSATATQLDATLSMPNGSTVTYTVTGTITSVPSGGNAVVTASIMRPADVTDPDATNPDAAAPSDPQAECDAAPSGVGCNNIKVSSIVVSPVPTTSNAGPDQSLCAVTSATLAGNNPTAGTGTWSQVNGPTTATFASATTFNTTVSNLATGTYNFRWAISSGPCTVSNDTVQIVVLPAVAGNTITPPATTTFCASGDPAVITGSTPTGGTGTYVYQWQSSADNTTFTNISGATSASYDPPVISATTYYRRLVTSGGCSTAVISNVVTMTVQPAIAGNTVTAPATTVFCGSGNADIITGATPTGGNGTYTYQWQSSTDNNTFTNIAGAVASGYDPVTSAVTTYYRRLVTSGSCTTASISNVITIAVNPALTSGAVGSTQTFCVSGDPAAFTQTTAPTGGNGTYTYQWQSSTDNSTFTNISGATAVTYDAPVISQTTYYRRVVSSSGCTDAISNVIIVTVTPTLTPGVVAASQTFCASGDPAAFTQTTAPTGGNGVYTYQWQSSTTSASSGFADISGATAAAYDAPALSVTTYFRRIVRSDACADGISNVLTVTINPSIANNVISANQTICSGSTPATLTGTTPTGGNGTYTYRWESSTTGTSGFAAAAGTNTTASYSPPALSMSTIYRRIVISGICGEMASNIIQVTVTAAAPAANAGPDQGPLNATSVTLAGNGAGTGSGTWTQVSGPNTATIQNASQPGTAVTNMVPGSYTFRWTITNAPCPATNDDVVIIINTPPVAANDAVTINEDTQATISVAANDTDADGTLAAGSVVIVAQPSNGTVTVNANNTVVYTPRADYNGTDNFTYTIKDNLGTVSNVATVTISITPVNDAPVAGDDKINALQDQALNLPPPGLLANDVDVDGDQLSASVVTYPANGTLVINSDGSMVYTPRAGFVGLDVFSYKVCDPSNNCDTASVTIDVGNVNDAPVANADTYTVLEDNTLTVAAPGVLSNDTDADGDALAASVVTGPTKGTLTLNTNGSFTYVPNANANGTDNFTYSACDASGACSNATVTINITPVNDRPLAVDDAYNTNEDVTLTITAPGVLSNDADPDGDILSVTVITGPAHGTLTLNAAGNFVYTPAANYNGIDNFTYRLCDNGSPQLCDTGLVTITVTPVNDTATVVNDTYTTAEDMPLSVTAPGVLANDTDVDGDVLTAAVVTQPAHGTLSFNANGSFVYTPNENYNGTDSYTYRACDPQGACRVGTVTITITAVNDAPVAIDDSYTLNEDATLNIVAPGILANDADPDGNPLTVTVITAPAHGTLTLNANGSFTYVPNADYNGADQFTYRVCDNGTPQLCDTGLVILTVNPVNDAPVATDDSYTVAEDVTLNVAAPGVLANDTDVDGNTLTVALISSPTNGTLTLNANGSFSYTPALNYNGPDSYTYRVCDNSGACDTGLVNITVTAVNDRPLAIDDNYTVAEDVTLTVNAPGVLFNDRDDDGDALSVSLLTTTANGTLTLNANGSFTFVPTPNFNGTTSFTYLVCDGGGLCDTGLAVINVTSVNDAPVAVADTYTVTEDVQLTVAAPGLLANDTDVDGDALNASLVAAPVHGTIVINSNGSFVYTPAANYNGVDSFTYKACDGSGVCSNAVVRLTVNAVNDAPDAVNDNYTIGEDRVLTIGGAGVLFNDIDIEGDPLTATLLTGPAHGTLTLNANGSFVYTPAANYNGPDNFTYRACDPGGLCDTATVTITVTPEADAPVAVDDNYTTAEDVVLTIAAPGLLANDTDADGDALTASVYSQPANGTVTVNANGSFVYTPNANFNGTDRFVYRVCDNGTPSLCDTGTVTITVTAVDDAPVTRDDNYAVDEDVVLTVPAAGVLLNDAELDGQTMTTALVSQPANGTVTMSANGGFVYTPNPNYNGLDTFVYRACDPGGNCTNGVVRIVVNAQNDAPVAVNDTYTFNEDTPLSGNVLSNDTDTDGDALIASINTQPGKGSVVLNANGTFVYTPDANVNGVDTFTYRVCDGSGACAIGRVTLNITPVNDTVQARDDEYNTPEDTPISIPAPGVLSNDIDIDGDPLTATLIGTVPASQGTITFNADGSFTFTPFLDFVGMVTVAYQVCDPAGACDTANIMINVGEVNDPPVAVDDNRPEYAVDEDNTLVIPASIGVLANDSDPDNITLSASINTNPANGTVTLNADGSFTYIPNPNFNGTDQFTYNVCDANSACDVGTVTVTVRPVNDAPVAGSQSVTTAEDTPVNGAVTGVTDVENDALTYNVVTNVQHGTLTLNADGTFTYTPAPDYNGNDQLVYQVCDNGTPSLCDTGYVNFTVTPVNDAPVAVNDEYTVPEDSTLSVPAVGRGVLNNDSDKDGETIVAVLETPGAGQLTLNLDGSFVYRPNLNFNGIDSFSYRACDVTNACSSAKVYITVTPVNDRPVAVADTFYRAEDTTITFPPGVVLANDIDADGDVLSGYPIGSLSNGTFVANPDGTYTYTPAPNFNGTDYIDYVVCDPGGLCDTGHIVLIIEPRNDVPVAMGDSYTVAEDNPLTVSAANGVLVNDTDADGEALASTVVTTTNGRLTLNTDGSFSYVPNLNFNGVDSFTYRACDVAGACDTAIVRITVTPVNDRPVAVDDEFTRSEDTVITFPPAVVLVNDIDVDGDVLTGTPLGNLTKGTFTYNPDGTYTYRPAKDFNGVDSIYYVVCDPGGLCDTGLIRLIITPVNDAPVANPVTYTVTEDVPLSESAPGIIGDDFDPDGDDIVAGIVTPPLHGRLTLSPDGGFTYTPDKDFNGSDSALYSLCDINGACDTAYVYFNVTPVNDPPVVAGTTFQVTEDVPLVITPPGVLANSSDPDGDVLTATLLEGPAHGQLTLNADGSFTYTPDPDYNGQDQFTVTICDSGNPPSCAPAIITLNIAAVDDAPVAVSDSLTTLEDTPLNVPAPGILANDINRDGDALSASIVTPATKGQITLDAGGNLTYTPNLNANGQDSAVYQLCKANGLCDTAKIYISITPVNDRPIAVDDQFIRSEDTVITFPPSVVLINDIDPDGDVLSGRPIGNLTKGSFTANPDGTYTYRPLPNFNGVDSIQYEVCDPGGLCDTGLIRLIITPVNDAPVAGDDSYTTDEDITLSVPSPGLLVNDSDVDDNDVQNVLILTNPAYGVLQLRNDNSFTYTPNANYNGVDTFLYVVYDAAGARDTGVVRITVNSVNDAPVAVDNIYTLNERTSVSDNVVTNDSDQDNDPLTAAVVTPAQHGTFVLNPNGSFTYTPNIPFVGTDVVTYQVCDPGGLCDTAIVTFNVQNVNDPPVAVDDAVTVAEDASATGNVLTNDSDPDGNALFASLITAPVHGTVVLNGDGSFTYTPDTDYNGADSLVYRLCDNGVPILCDTGVVRFTVIPVNDKPVATDDALAVTEDTPGTGNVLTNDTDLDGDALTASLVTAPVNGTVVLNADGSFTYTPSLNYNGPDSLVYQACDPGGLCDTAVVRFTVSALNDAPVGVDDNVTVTEDTTATGNILANDTDVEGNTLTASLVTAPVNGTVVLNADGSFTYTPDLNYNGADSLVYQVCDNGVPSLCDTAVVRFTVSAVNDAPVAVDDNVTVTEDVSATGNVLTNDTDLEGDALTASLVTAPVNGTVVLNADGSFTYTPNANYSGADSLVYRVCDNGVPSLCDSGVVRFNITAVNDQPVADDDNVTVVEDVPTTGNVLTNDTDPEGDALTASLVTAPVNGTVVLNADGSFTYTPNANYNGADSLVYAVCDNGTPSTCDTGVVRFTVTAVNDAPVAVDDNVTVTEDTPVTGNVLTNDTDVEGNTLTASLVTAPVNGTIVLNADGSFTYTPNVNYNGLDSLVYQVCDNGVPSLCDSGVIRFMVTAMNDQPLAVDDNVTVLEDVPTTGNVLTNDTDPEGNTLTASLVTAPVNGTVVLNADGSFTYTPNANYNGADSLVYTVCDNGTPSVCDTGVVRFDVTAVNDKPLVVDDNVTVVEDVPTTGNVLTNDTDPEGDALTASLVTAPVNGTVVLNADGSFTYTPNANYNGTDSLVYAVCDNGTPSVCDTGVVRFNVTAVNDAPVAVDDNVTVTEGTPATGNVFTNDTDVEGNALTASLVTAPVNGTVVLNADGSFTYTPNANYSGADSLIYQVCDSGVPLLCDTAVVRFTVSAVNDAPVAVDDNVTVVEDVPTTGNVLTNDTDPEGNALTASLVTAPVNGTIVLNADGSFTYTPNANYNGADSLVYAVCDNGTPSTCDTGVVRFNVTAVNDAPVAVDDNVTVVEDVPTTGNVLTNDTDPEGDALTASLVTAPVNGTVVLNADGSFTYTPNANYNGADSLVYTVCDNGTPSVCDTGVVRFNVTAVNDKPLVVDDNVTVVEDVPTIGNVLTNDTDPEGDALTASLVTAPVNGTVVLNADGSFTYTPNTNYNGTDSLVYAVCDNGTPSVCDTGVVRFNVTAVNDAPVAVDDNVTVTEGIPATGNVLTNDTDVEGNTLTASLVTAPVNGTVVLNADGSFTYTPNANYSGADSLIYRVCDNGVPSLCDTAVVRFNIAATNDAPVAVDDNIAVTEDTPATGNVLTNDSDPEGDALTASLVTAPVNGTVVLNADGSFTYTPNANYNGLDSLVYQVCDNGTPGLCDTAIVRFMITAVGDAPVAVPDTANVIEDTPATGNVLTNDTNPDGGTLTASLISGPAHGTFILNPDGSYTYTPAANYNGADSIVYRVCNSNTPPQCDSGILRFVISAVNDAPVAVNDSVIVTGSGTNGNALTNDSDPEGDALTASLVTAPLNGTAVLNANGTFTYTPAAGYKGRDSLVYRVCDNGTPSLCDTAIIYFNVANRPPVAVNDTVPVNFPQAATGNVLTNDSDPNGDPLTATVLDNPAHGTIVLNADGSFTYTPSAGYVGRDSVNYQVCDNDTPALCDTAKLLFIVPNLAPVANNDTLRTLEGQMGTVNLFANDSDQNPGTILNATLIQAPQNGQMVVNAFGSATYMPNPGFQGIDSAYYMVCDNGTPALCDTAKIVIIVGIANFPPVAVDDTLRTLSGIPVTGNFLDNDSDPENQTLTLTILTPPVNGTIVRNQAGDYTYTPASGFVGSDSLIYRICDNGTPSRCDTTKVLILVGQGNLTPIAVNDTVAVNNLQPATGNVMTNDSDPDGNLFSASLVTAPTNGTVVLNADGSFTYTATPGFTGTDFMDYRICDNGAPSLCDTARVIFNVSQGNRAPIAVNDTVAVNNLQPATGNVMTNDSDPDGNTLTASVVTAPANGTVVLNANGSFTYTANPGFTGTDFMDYRICDNGTPGLCDTARVIFNVGQGNRAPIAVNDTVAVNNLQPATGNVMTNDSDPDGNTLTASVVTAPANGTIVLNANGSFTYTADPGFTGTDFMDYRICDNGTPGLCDTARVIFNVGQGNRAPIAVNDTVAVNNLQPATGNVMTNDSDPDGNTLTASVVTAPANGTIVLNANGSFTYTATPGFTGTDFMDYRICDNGTPGLCDTARVIFNVGQGNRAPIAVNDTVAVNNLQPATGNVMTNDSDPDGNTLTASVVTAPANGTIVLNANGSFTYTADPGFTGTDFMDYRICDNGTPGLCDTARVIFNVGQGNRAPIANNDTARTNSLIPVTGNVLSNDLDPDGNPLTTSVVTAPASGTIVLNADGSFTYTPDPAFTGITYMDYKVCDNGTPQLCDTARLVIIVGQGNRAPVAANDTARTYSPQPISGNALLNDRDPDGDALTATLISGPANGTLTISAAGVFTYTPNVGFVGTDGATYQVCDNGTPVLCDTGFITFVVTPNLPPVAKDDTIRVTGLQPGTGNVLVNDTDPNSRSGLTASVVTGPRNGTLVINPNGSVTYTPDAGFYGLDSAYYKVCDNGTPALCDTAKIIFVISDISRARIGTAKAVSEPKLLVDGSYEFTYTFVIRNMGTIDLAGIQLIDDLTNVFPSPMDVRVINVRATGALVPDAQYNGRGNINLLAFNSELARGATDSVQLLLRVFPNKRFGTFNNSATAKGNTLAGSEISDVSTTGLEPDNNGDGMPAENAPTPVTLVETKIRIPEGFSPNGDGKNDKFVIANVGTDKIALEVYNRWGNVVYSSKDYQNDWDGRCNTGIRYGEEVPDGTYYYIVNNLTTGEKYVNYITIMR